MNSEKFNKIVEDRCSKIVRTLAQKAREYALNDDRLHNFNVASRLSNQPREVALWGMALKHYVSILDMIEGTKEGTIPSEAMINEKIGDLINYLILLEASFKDKIK